MSTAERVPDLDGLEDYAARDDRRPALFFAGRDREIGTMERLCARALSSIRAGERFEGATRLFQGAPGAGKSLLLSELEQRWTAGNASADAPRPVPISWSMLESEEDTSRAILQAVEPSLEEETRHTRTGDVSARAGLPVLGGEARTGSSIAPAALNLHQLARTLHTASWNRPLCLTVDAIQNVTPEAKNVLNQLHLGVHGLPIVPVFAGLGDSYDHLSGCAGLSRFSLDAIHDIGRLALEEAGESVIAMLSAFHVDIEGGNADGWATRLAEESEGWPQHLHNGMRALAAGLVEARGRLANVDAGSVLRREAEFRTRLHPRPADPPQASISARRFTLHPVRDAPMTGMRAAQRPPASPVRSAVPGAVTTRPPPKRSARPCRNHRGLPGRLVHINAAAAFCRSFLSRDNTWRRHGGIAMPAPDDVHHGRAPGRRERTLRAGRAQHPERLFTESPGSCLSLRRSASGHRAQQRLHRTLTNS